MLTATAIASIIGSSIILMTAGGVMPLKAVASTTLLTAVVVLPKERWSPVIPPMGAWQWIALLAAVFPAMVVFETAVTRALLGDMRLSWSSAAMFVVMVAAAGALRGMWGMLRNGVGTSRTGVPEQETVYDTDDELVHDDSTPPWMRRTP